MTTERAWSCWVPRRDGSRAARVTSHVRSVHRLGLGVWHQRWSGDLQALALDLLELPRILTRRARSGMLRPVPVASAKQRLA